MKLEIINIIIKVNMKIMACFEWGEVKMISTLISDGRIASVELGNINNNAFWIGQYWRDSEINYICRFEKSGIKRRCKIITQI